jgi:hypothetical protein
MMKLEKRKLISKKEPRKKRIIRNEIEKTS